MAQVVAAAAAGAAAVAVTARLRPIPALGSTRWAAAPRRRRRRRLSRAAAEVDRGVWLARLRELRDAGGGGELVVRDNYGRDGVAALRALAAELGLHSQAYGKGTSTVLVVSTDALPNYRAELDARHGQSQRRIALAGATEDRVERMLAELRQSPQPREEEAAALSSAAIDDRAPLGAVDSWEDVEMGPQEAAAAAADTAAVKRWQRSKHENREEGGGVDSMESESRQMRERQRTMQATEQGRAMRAQRARLPAFGMRAELLRAVSDNQVVVISGETGCGKTTQLPQFILEEAVEAGRGAAVSIICTQPRRISAVSVAGRVAMERGEAVSGAVGYQIRLESRASSATRLLFCTTGVLLRKLVKSPMLEGVTHVVVDEIHERGMNEDFLIIVLRDLLPRRRDLRLVLMSATINAHLFSKYLGGAPMAHIPGYTYPVEELFLEDVLERTRHMIGDDKEGRGDRGGSWPASAAAAGQGRRVGRRSRDAAPALPKDKDPMVDVFEQVDITMEYGRYSPSTRASLEHWSPEVLDLDLVLFLGSRLHRCFATHGYRRVIRCPCDGLEGGALRVSAFAALAAETATEGPCQVASTVDHICSSEAQGAVLVFLTGWDDIAKLAELLRGRLGRAVVLPLHGSMPTVNQKEIFQRPPHGTRKVVLATNIAETSITIDDVVYVVDCGKAKETRYDALNKLECLAPTWISQASARQRRGRAGRVQPGVCYRLYPRVLHDALPKFQTPEMLRTPLQELCLQIKDLQLGELQQFLAKALQPPEPLAVQNATELLRTIGALDKDEELTPLGWHLASLPIDPRLGKMLLIASLLGCLGPSLTIAAALSHREPFVLPVDRKEAADEAKRRFSLGTRSDHVALLQAYDGWMRAKRQGNERSYCWDNFLSQPALQMISTMRLQFFDLLSDIGFVDRVAGIQEYNRLGTDLEAVRAVLVAGLFPSVAQIKRKGRRVEFFTREDGRVAPHPSSVNAREGDFREPWLVYGEKVKTKEIYLRDTSAVSDYALLLFGGELSPRAGDGGFDMLGGYLQFSATPKTAQLVHELRAQLDQLLQRKIDNPHLDLHSKGRVVMTAVMELLHS
eukprot:SM000252S09075  [mRNA]  locus=s252:79854:86589:- [translate_table: standard]